MRCHHQAVEQDARAVSVHVRHASVEMQVQCVNVVIVVVLGELHIVRVVPVVVGDDAAVRRNFRRGHLTLDFAVFGRKVFTLSVGDSRLPSAVTKF